MEAAECGAASLSSVLLYYGKNVPAEQLRIDTGTSLGGSSAGDILRAAEKYGLEGHGYKTDATELMALQVPAILHWNHDHFVVFEGFKRGYAYVNDPALGRCKLTFEELSSNYSGIALTFRPGSEFQKTAGEGQKKHNAEDGYLNASVLLTGLILPGFILAFSGLAVPVCAQILIDRIITGSAGIAAVVAIMLFSAAFYTVFVLIRRHFLDNLRKKILIQGGGGMLYRILRMPLGFYKRTNAGDLAGRLDDLNELTSHFSDVLAPAVIGAAAILIYSAAFLVYSPALFAIAFAAVILMILAHAASERLTAPDPVKLRRDKARLAGTVLSGLAVTGTLKANGAEDSYVSRVLADNYALHSTSGRRRWQRELLKALPLSIRVAGGIWIIAACALPSIRSSVSGGILAALLILYMLMTGWTKKIALLAGNGSRVKIGKKRIEDIMTRDVDARYLAGTGQEQVTSKLNGELVLRDVSYSYGQSGRHVLRGVNITLAPGDHVYVTGDSGCGKSTLARIMSGLYDPSGGSISFDGFSRDRISAEAFSASVTLCDSLPAMFSGTVRDNITMWNPNVRESDVIAAAKDACIHDFITGRPGAYGARLSEGGSNLSTGQKQRLGIARALAVNPSVLILDEALSAVDPAVKKQIIDNLRKRGCTLVITGKRDDEAESFDRVITLEEGSQRG